MTELSISKNIQELRKQKNMTQEELSRISEVPYTTLIKVESRFIKNPTIKTLVKISKALNVTIEALIYD